jgi:large subunit ribosomal protein L24
MKLKIGDSVVIIAGKHKGQTGTIKQTVPAVKGVIIEGVNTVKKHRKQGGKNKPAGIFEETQPINVSNVAIAHPTKKGKPARVGYKTDNKGKKVRVIKQANNKEIK